MLSSSPGAQWPNGCLEDVWGCAVLTYRLLQRWIDVSISIADGLRWATAFACFAAVSSPGQVPSASGKAARPVLRTVIDVPLPGPAVRFDYQSLDPTSGHLYIAHMNADHLVVFDTAQRKVIGNLAGFARVHGVWVVPELGRVYASVTGGRRVNVVDTKTLEVISQIGPISYPDGLTYAPGPKRIFVSDEHGKADAVIDARTNRLLTSLPLGGQAGNTVYDSGSKQILVAVHETNELVAIDPEAMRIVGRTRLAGVAKPHGVAIDAVHRLAFVAGQRNRVLALVDLKSMKVLATYPVGRGPDVLAFDAGLGQLYVSSESGSVSVFHLRGEQLVLQGELSMPHAHTVAVDTSTHLVYFPLENVDGHPLLRIMETVIPQD
jgi:DNA-binding beta-propeller fold protein YncE